MEINIPIYDKDVGKKDHEHFFVDIIEPDDPPQPDTLGPHSHDHYILGFLYEGMAAHFADMEQNAINGPAILVLDVNQVHVHTPLNDCKVVFICFSPAFVQGQGKSFNSCMELVFSQSHITLSADKMLLLDQSIKQIQSEYDKGIARNTEIIQCLLNILLIQCSAYVEKSTATLYSGNGKLCVGFKELLRQHHARHHQVKFYANELNVTTEILNQAVKRTISRNAKQVIDEQLVTEAKKLLYWSDVTAREVAWALGFETDGYFNRFFKKHTGQTPKEFQKSINFGI